MPHGQAPSRSASPSAAPVLLSFDVEAYFQIEAARDCVPKTAWPSYDDRLAPVIDWLLERLAHHHATATFFTLGYIADRQPKLIRRIVEAGHELACHGHMHDRLHTLWPEALRQDLHDARHALEQAAGCAVTGYRAPTFSLDRSTAWALDVLAEQGFTYDSSIQPIRRAAYGVADAPIEPFRLPTPSGATLLELPPLVWQLARYHLPTAGGGYFRLFPPFVMHRAIEQAHGAGRPAVLYFHPWEFDPDQPRLPLTGLRRFRTYVNLHRTRDRLDQLLRRHPATSIARYLAKQNADHWPTWPLTATAAPTAHLDAA
jgi:polysaccharide deacetylase family protein (PEP-CTERM system associated)